MDLSQIKLSPWLLPTAKNLMDMAEELFGTGTGASKKAWVRNALLDAAKGVDLPTVPNWIEDPAKTVIVDFLIEVIWGLHFQGPDLGRLIRAGRRLPA